jgi:hypothetical protein
VHKFGVLNQVVPVCPFFLPGGEGAMLDCLEPLEGDAMESSAPGFSC